MRLVTGLTDAQLTDYELHAELATVEALQKVADTIADRIGQIQVASGRVRWDGCPYGLHPAHAGPCTLIAADDVPDDGLPPGQPYVSPDDLAAISPLWQEAVAQTILPVVAEVWQASSGSVYAQMVDATNITALPSVGSLAAEQYLAQAANTFAEVGDDLWATARTQLLEGFEQGESIPQLAARVRGSAGLTAKTATLVARTQVLDASNAGSYATAQVSGLDLNKGWLDTPDLRTRPSHRIAGETYGSDEGMIPFGDQFTVGGFQCDRPHDPVLPPAERYSCRCTLVYSMPGRAVEQAVKDAEPEPPIPNTSGVDELAAQQHAEVKRVFDEVHEAFEGLGLPPVRPPGGFPNLPSLRAPGDVIPGGAVVEAGVRPVLASARTQGAVERVFREEFERITGRKPRYVDFPGSAATAREHAEGLLRGLERFPDAKLDSVGPLLRPVRSEYAHAAGGTIRFNYDDWTRPARRKAYLESLQGDVAGWEKGVQEFGLGLFKRSAFHPRGTGNPIGVALHEFGHVLDIATVQKAIRGDLDKLLKARTAQATRRPRPAGETPIAGPDDLIQREISAYAASDHEELVAEAFVDVMMNGQRASLLSREIFDLLEAEYRRGGGVVRDALPEQRLLPSMPAPKPVARMTVAELRTEASARGVAVPAGARKADIVRLLDEGAPTPAAGRVLTGREALEAAPVDLSGVRRVPGVTPTQRRSVDNYLSDAQRMNDQIRRGEMSTRVAADVRRIDQVLDRSVLTSDVEVFRGLRSGREIFGDARDLTGFEWTESAFLSTTADRQVAAQFAGSFGDPAPVIMRIVTPAGTKAIKLGDLGAGGALGDQAEMLLQRGLRLRVVADRGLVTESMIPVRVRILDVEVVPGGAVPVAVPTAGRTVAQSTARQKLIDKRRQVADFNADTLAALLDAQVDTDVLVRLIQQSAARNAIPKRTVDSLVTAARSGDPAKVEAVARIARTAKVQPLARTTDIVPYDPKTMQALERAQPGQKVRVIRPGHTADVDGEPVQLSKSVVEVLTAKEIRDIEGRALRQAARETNRLIEARTGTARLLAEVDELISKGASKATILQRLDVKLTAPEQIFAGADPAIVKALADALATGDMVKLRSALTRAGTKAKIKPISRAGAKAKYDPDLMEPFAGDIPAGAQVVVVTRGSSLTLPDGTVLQLTKARVQPLPVKLPPGPPSVRKSGLDMTDSLTRETEWLRAAARGRDRFGPGRYHDPVLTQVVRHQPGWSDPARVVTPAALDRAIGSGWTEMWRGIKTDVFPESAPASKIAEATRTGKWEMGQGMYGNGIYTSVRRTTAEVYRGADLGIVPLDPVLKQRVRFGPAPLHEFLGEFDVPGAGRGGLIRMALDPDAKIIDYPDLKAEHIAYLRSIDFMSMPESAYKRSLNDSSFYAAMRGYDGVRIHGPLHNDGAEYPPGVANADEPPQYIIFNRSVLIFERASTRYDS